MPRQSKTDRVLAEREERLKDEVANAAAMAERLASELRLVRDLRKQLAALPKRTSRAKNRVATASNAAPSTATVA